MDPAEAKRILDLTECPFTWGIRSDRSHGGLIRKYTDFLRNDDHPSFLPRWSVRICLAFLMFKTGEAKSAVTHVESAVRDLSVAEDSVSKRYVVACQHIVFATKLWMNYLIWGTRYKYDLNVVPPVENLSDSEKGGLFGIKARILRELVGMRIMQVVPFLKRAIELDPEQSDWKISLVATLCRDAKYVREKEEKAGIYNCMSESSVDERLDLIESIFNSPLTRVEKTSILYYKAVTLADYCRRRPRSDKTDEYRQEIDRLCGILLKEEPEKKTYRTFVAKWFQEH